MANLRERLGQRLQALVLLLCLVCTASESAPITHGEPKEIQIGVTEIPTSLSPYALNTSNALAHQYSHLFFDPLMRWSTERELELRLLSATEQLDDGSIRFTLKRNIRFHSGNIMTSDDVLWSFKEAMSNKYLQRKMQHKIQLTQLNAYQFDIRTQLTQAQLFDYLTHLFVLDSAYYKKHKIDYNFVQSSISEPITVLPLSGTGPYQVASFSPGLSLRVKESEHYWEARPTFTHIKFIKIQSSESRLYALLAGDIDISESVAHRNINSTRFLSRKDVYQAKSTNALFLIINDQKNSALQRQTMRNALHLGINQGGILKHILHGMGRVDNSYKLIASPVLPPAYDATRAKYLLKKTNAPKELSMLVLPDNFPYNQEVVLALKNMMQKVGITLRVTEALNIKQWDRIKDNYDLQLSMWHSPLIEKSNVYQDIFTNSFLSAHLAGLFNDQQRDLSMEEKIILFDEYQLSDRIIPLFSKNKIWASDKRYDLKAVFSVNAIPYWHRLTFKAQSIR